MGKANEGRIARAHQALIDIAAGREAVQCLAADLGSPYIDCGVGDGKCAACRAAERVDLLVRLLDVTATKLDALEKTTLRMVLEPERRKIAAQLRELATEAFDGGSVALHDAVMAYAAKLESGL